MIALGVYVVTLTSHQISTDVGAVKVVRDPQTFKDVLQMVLAVAGLAIAVFGAGAYRLLSQQIEEKVASSSEKRLRIANAIHKIDFGLVYWDFFRRSAYLAKPDRLAYLDRAVEWTRQAYEGEVAGLGDQEREVERLMLQIRNNWAYYIYEKDLWGGPGGVSEGEKRTALSFVGYVEERRVRHPDLAFDLLDTIDRVRARFRPQG